MKYFYIILACIVFVSCPATDPNNPSGTTGNASISTSPWTRLIGSDQSDTGRDIAVDASGNVFVTGYARGCFHGKTNLGESEDIFIAKYTQNGDLAWLITDGTVSNDSTEGICLDSAGNVYITGSSRGNIFGNTNEGGQDLFVAKYDQSGQLIWGKNYGTPSGQWGEGGQKIRADQNGNLYIVGWTQGGLGETRIGHQDILVIKLSANDGSIVWKKIFGIASEFSYGYGIALDSTGVYFTGGFKGSIDGQAYAGAGDIILGKLSVSDGSLLWARLAGSATAYEVGCSLSIDASGNVYLAGRGEGSFDEETSNGGYDIIVMKYSSDGTKIWTRLVGTDNNDEAWGICSAPNNHVYVAGSFYNGVGEFNLHDIAILKYSSTGTLVASNIINTGKEDEGRTICTDANNSVYVTGKVCNNLDGQTNTGDVGSADVVILKKGANIE